MALTTAHDLATLGSWDFLTDYARNKTEFILLGKIVYQTLAQYTGNPPNGPSELEQPLTGALRVANIFKTLCASKQHANPSLYPVFALSLARYILDNEWINIVRP